MGDCRFDPGCASEIDIAKMDLSKQKEVYDLLSDTFYEMYPHLTFSSFEQHQKDWNFKSPTSDLFRFIAEEDEKIVGYGMLFVRFNDENKKEIEFSGFRIFVNSKYRNKGIGTNILQRIIAKAKTLNITSLKSHTNTESGKHFLENLNGEILTTNFNNYLKLGDANWYKLDEIKRKCEKKTPEIEIEITKELGKNDELQFLDLMVELNKDINDFEKNRNFDETKYRSSFYKKRVKDLEEGNFFITALAKTKTGEIVALSELLHLHYIPNELYCEISGTKATHRGKGLCKRLKTELLEHVKENYPQITMITTANHEENHVMRKINTLLGYKQSP